MERRDRLQIQLSGGWSTNLGPVYGGAVGAQAGVPTLSVPWLDALENAKLSLGGWPRKLGGSMRRNAVAIEESAVAVQVNGVFDYWRQEPGSGSLQQILAFAGTLIVKDDGDGTFDTIATGRTAGARPWMTVFDNLAILSSDSASDLPLQYDGVSTSLLSASAPTFAFAIPHKNRLWAATGRDSRLHYSGSLDPTDWTGDGAGSIDIDPDDGDVITGLVSLDDLYVFKGPHANSIHRILGSTPSGDDPFVRRPLAFGLSAINQASILRVGQDVFFVSEVGVHSLIATAKYGDIEQTYLSFPILDYFTGEGGGEVAINPAMLKFTQGVNDRTNGRCVWTMAARGSNALNECLVYDYRFSPGRWGRWTGYVPATALGLVQYAGRAWLHAGLATGYVERLDVPRRFVLGNSTSGYTYRWETPYLDLGNPSMDKNAEEAYVGLVPKGTSTATLSYQRDIQTTQTVAISQAGTGGFILGTSLLGTGILGAGGAYQTKHATLDSSNFRALKLALAQGTAGVDCEPYALELHGKAMGVTQESQ